MDSRDMTVARLYRVDTIRGDFLFIEFKCADNTHTVKLPVDAVLEAVGGIIE